MSETPEFRRLPQLKDPEVLFFRILDEVPDMAIWIDQDGHIIYVNASACRRLGYTQEELLGSSFFGIAPAYPREDLDALFADIRIKKALSFELEQQTKSGEAFPAEVRVTYLSLGDQELLCGLVIDITEQKKADDEVLRLYTIQKRREHRLQALIQNAQGGVVPVSELQALLEE